MYYTETPKQKSPLILGILIFREENMLNFFKWLLGIRELTDREKQELEKDAYLRDIK